MKTSKSRVISGLMLLIALTPFLFTSCSDEYVDLRDELTGQYDYVVKIFAIDNQGDLVYLGDQEDHYDLEGTMRVTKNADPDVIDFWDGNVLMFNGIDPRDTGNAIVFDIPDQEGWVGPVNVQVSGYKYWDVDNKSYDGAFLFDDESIEIAFSARIMDVDTGLVMVLTAFRN